MTELADIFRRYGPADRSEFWGATAAQHHRAILEAIKAKDPHKAEEMMFHHTVWYEEELTATAGVRLIYLPTALISVVGQRLLITALKRARTSVEVNLFYSKLTYAYPPQKEIVGYNIPYQNNQ
jgi:hypothetical protein